MASASLKRQQWLPANYDYFAEIAGYEEWRGRVGKCVHAGLLFASSGLANASDRGLCLDDPLTGTHRDLRANNTT